MKTKMPDIDIDFADRSKLLSIIKYIKASRLDKENRPIPHNTGVYLQTIPHNLINNLSNIDYKSAETRGYFKIDFLNVSIYKDIKNEHHLNDLMNIEPMWELLQQKEFTDLLFHLKDHHAILVRMKPNTVEQLAAILAIIRPAKKHLIGKDWDTILKEIWIKPDNDDYYFKKSHGIAYAMAIIVQMNLICQQISYDYS